MNAKKQGLGRGLNALLENTETDITGKNAPPLFSVAEIPISDIEANPFQPRENFNDKELDELVESIKVHGLIQPVTVRKMGYGKYQLISGERRTRAAIRAGLEKIPAYIRVADDQGMLEMSLIENIHRENLNAIEIAISYKRLIEECNLKHEDVAARIGKDRSTVTNYLRLLKLPVEIQVAIRDQQISMGHARCLIGIEEPEVQLRLLKLIIEEDLSVREVEELARQSKDELIEVKPQAPEKKKAEKPEKIIALERELSEKTQLKIKIKIKKQGKGEMILPFNSEEELESITRILNRE